jgi:hypothetical protein
MERRDKIGRYAFDRVLPLDHFAVREGRLAWEDLSATHGFGGSGPIRVTWSSYDNQLDTRAPLEGATTPYLPKVMADGYYVADLVQMRTPKHQVAVFFRNKGTRLEIVGIEYKW